MILFGLRDIGSANACLSVIKILRNKDVPVSVYAEGLVCERFKDRFSFIPERNIDILLDSVRPSLVTVTCAMPGGAIPIEMTRKAKQRNLPVVLIEEMWSGHSAFVWDILPDGVCVMDEFAKSLIQQSWLNYSESCIHITGSSVFDKFVGMDTESAKHKLRESLSLSDNWPVIFFPGTGLVSGIVDVVRMLIESLNSLGIPAYFILRNHPSVTFSKASEYREALSGLKVGQVVDSSKVTSNEVNAGSDIVVGTFSTMTVEACYLRKPVLIISTSEINQLLAEATNNTLSQWPLINLGAALKAGSVDEIKNCLNQILAGNITNMLEAQRKHFQTDVLSADRIANAILSYYK